MVYNQSVSQTLDNARAGLTI